MMRFVSALSAQQEMKNGQKLANQVGRSALTQRTRLLDLKDSDLLDEPVKNFAGLPALWPRFVDASSKGGAERFERLLAGIELSVLPKVSVASMGPLAHERDFLLSLVKKIIAPNVPDRSADILETILHRCLAFQAASKGGAQVGATVWSSRTEQVGMEEDVVHALAKVNAKLLDTPLHPSPDKPFRLPIRNRRGMETRSRDRSTSSASTVFHRHPSTGAKGKNNGNGRTRANAHEASASPRKNRSPRKGLAAGRGKGGKPNAPPPAKTA
jgi:hypothetical protein